MANSSNNHFTDCSLELWRNHLKLYIDSNSGYITSSKDTAIFVNIITTGQIMDSDLKP